MAEGTVYLVPSPLNTGQEALLELPAASVQILAQSQHFIVEDLRTARRLIAAVPGHRPIDELKFALMGKHDNMSEATAMLQLAKAGSDIVVLSEAGSPCVADPGSFVVAEAHRLRLNIKPLSGPSSIIQALMASGFNGQQFAFHGYLPIASGQRKEAIRKMEKLIYTANQTQIFIETPFRNEALLNDLIAVCQPSTLLCVAAAIGSAQEKIIRFPVSWWKNSRPSIGKVPAVFLLGKELIVTQ